MMRNNKRLFVGGGCVIAVAMLVVFFVVRKDTKNQHTHAAEKADLVANAAKSNAGKLSQSGKAASKVPDKRDKTEMTDATVTTKVLDGLLDDDNISGVLREASHLKKDPNPDVRSRVAFALNWTGIKGLAELTSMLGDPDPEVASEVMSYWKMQLAEVESSSDKAALLSAAVDALGTGMNSDTLSDLLMEFTMLDELDAVPNLVELLKRTNDPSQSRDIIDAIDPIINSDTPLETKDDVDNAVGVWLREKMAEQDEAAVETTEATE